MRHRYRYLDPNVLRELLAGLELERLFNQLLLAAGGDPARASEWLRELKDRGYFDEGVDIEAFLARLEEHGVLQRDHSGALLLAAGGQRRLRRQALEEVFSSLKKAAGGFHAVQAAGGGSESVPETRPWEFGDELDRLDPARSTQNALKRTHGSLELAEADLEVHESEHLTSCATVIAIDISHSMVLYGEDRITPAKTVALAMAELITSKYPKDYLATIVFGDRASPIPLADIAKIQAGPYHTNTAEALQMARGILGRRKQPNRQLFLITDGKPSAISEGKRLYKNPYGLDIKIVTRTLEEADACRRDKVVITTFMLATDAPLQEFVAKLTRVNRGRAYFASPIRLGEYVLADYITNRRRRVH